MTTLPVHDVRPDSTTPGPWGPSVELCRWVDGWVIVRSLTPSVDPEQALCFRMIDLTRAANFSRLTETALTYYQTNPGRPYSGWWRRMISDQHRLERPLSPRRRPTWLPAEYRRWWWFVEATSPEHLANLFDDSKHRVDTDAKRRRFPKADRGALSYDPEVWLLLDTPSPAFWPHDQFLDWVHDVT